MIQSYRKRPVVIQAVQWSDDPGDGVEEFLGADFAGYLMSNAGVLLRVRTLEGDIFAAPGDYIIRGVQGEHYPCKPDIFHATYEPAFIEVD